MKVCVAGLWHLGCVTAACLASVGHDVTGLDGDEAVIAGLNAGQAPLFEPGLDQLLSSGLGECRLRFTTSAAEALSDADVLWVTLDTPVNDDDEPIVSAVTSLASGLFPHLPAHCLVLLSSQIPVGTTGSLERAFAGAYPGRDVGFAYLPENLRLGKAIDVFTHPDRVIAGVRRDTDRDRIATMLSPVTDNIEWMSVESAEMTKHAINAFLATSVTFINEIASVCEQVGADAADVARGLKTEARIGPKAYLSPGAAFAGGTLARDVVALTAIGRQHGLDTHLLSSIRISNDAHSRWAQRRLEQLLGGVDGKKIAVWGLTYKAGTDTLRRSRAVELCEWLTDRGAHVTVHDPAVHQLPTAFAQRVTLTTSPELAAVDASALVISTAWPDYRTVSPLQVVQSMKRRLVLDAERFVGDTFGRLADIEYLSVGRSFE